MTPSLLNICETAGQLFLRSCRRFDGRSRLGRNFDGRSVDGRSHLGGFFCRSYLRPFLGRGCVRRRFVRRRHIAVRRRVSRVTAATRRRAGLSTSHRKETNGQNQQQQTQTFHRTPLKKTDLSSFAVYATALYAFVLAL